MDRQQIATMLVLEQLGTEPSMETFRDRLVVQKSIYLCQAAGLDLGYFYSWYLHGPYCSALTRDVFGALDNSEEIGRWRGRFYLGESTMERLERLKDVFSEHDSLGRAKWLELLASVHFLIDRKQVGDADARSIAERLQAYGKDFGEEEVERALDALREGRLLSQ